MTAIGEVLSYSFDSANDQAARTDLIERVYRSLVPGGLWLFDIAGPERAKPGESRRTFAEGPDWAVLVETAFDATTSVLTRHITSFRQVGEFYRRHAEIHRLTLIDPRLDGLAAGGTTIITAEPAADPRLPRTAATHDLHTIATFRCGDMSLVRVNRQPSQTVSRVLDTLPTARAIEPHEVLRLSHVNVRPHGPTDHYLYLDPARFCPLVSEAIRPLTLEGRPLMASCHTSLPPHQREYVEIDHPIVYGYLVGQQLVAAASHFLFIGNLAR